MVASAGECACLSRHGPLGVLDSLTFLAGSWWAFKLGSHHKERHCTEKQQGQIVPKLFVPDFLLSGHDDFVITI